MSATMNRTHIEQSTKQELRKLSEATSDPVAKAVLAAIAEVPGDEVLTISAPPKDLTPNDAAEILGVSRTYINKLLKEGKIEYYMVGSHKRIPFSAFERFQSERLEAQRAFAESLAKRETTATGAIDELMDLM